MEQGAGGTRAGARGIEAGTAWLAGGVLLAACVLGSTWALVDAFRRGSVALHAIATREAPAAVAPAHALDPERRVRIDTRDAPARGRSHAKVTVVEFGDFGCDACRRTASILDRLHAELGDRVRFVFKHLPAAGQGATATHRAAAAAARQDRFWELRARLLAAPPGAAPEGLAAQEPLDLARFRADLDARASGERVQSDAREAGELGIPQAPAVYVNGWAADATSYEGLRARIRTELSR